MYKKLCSLKSNKAHGNDGTHAQGAGLVSLNIQKTFENPPVQQRLQKYLSCFPTTPTNDQSTYWRGRYKFYAFTYLLSKCSCLLILLPTRGSSAPFATQLRARPYMMRHMHWYCLELQCAVCELARYDYTLVANTDQHGGTHFSRRSHFSFITNNVREPALGTCTTAFEFQDCHIFFNKAQHDLAPIITDLIASSTFITRRERLRRCVLLFQVVTDCTQTPH